MAKTPKTVEIHAYQVGFGDCFLVTFDYGGSDRRSILIDFGTTGLPGKKKPSTHMPHVANQIKADCGGRLTAVVATHRHADHISGFATDGKTGKSGVTIRDLRPKVVLQPWTEDPEAKTNAKRATRDSSRSAKSFVAGLAAMHDIAQAVKTISSNPPAWMSAALRKELAFLGEDNIANKSAVDNLIAMGKAKGARAVWAHHGSPSGLDALLPGVKVRVLGPPNLEQTEKIKKMRSRDPDQFWHLLSGPKSLQGGSALVHGIGRSNAGGGGAPAEARWFRKRLDRMRGDQLLQIVRTLDSQMNNTSLILLFEVGGKKLLFPGDAQIENWSYALQDAKDAKRTTALLAGVDVYKVGHHGSLNATPKKLLWEKFTKRGKPVATRLQTLLSTMPGKHGKTSNKTEVPRIPLLKALDDETVLHNTNKLQATELSYTVVVKL
jgi:L-ascorbate metabolism protein UlaG (beta-lactamase superfamily)